MTTDIHTHRLKAGVVPERPRLFYHYTRNRKQLFIRLLDVNKETMRGLFRFLAHEEIDVAEAKQKFGETGAMEVPGYLYVQLSKYYRMVELSLEDWLRPGPEEEA